MSKKISEMTLEELQDYALSLETERNGLNEQITGLNTQIQDLNAVNLALQKRNNDLFMRVEQGKQDDGGKDKEPETPPKTCEQFAKDLILGGSK